MPGLNSSLNIGLSGLQATQGALNVVGHNITNISTPNYSRQVVNLSTAGAISFGNQMYGQGVTLTSISGIRNRLLDLQISQTLSRQTGAQTRDASIEAVSTAFEETDDYGLSALVENFFQGFQDLAANPENDALRTNLVGQAQTLVDGLKSQYRMLAEQRDAANVAVSDQVAEVNTLTEQIATLNKAVAQESATGGNSDARDQRAALVEKLSKLVGIQAFEDDSGRLQIMLDSGTGILVAGDKANRLTATADPSLGNYYRVDVVSGSGVATDVTGSIQEGSLGANLDLRDNIIGGYQSQLDQLAAGIAGGVNQLHYAGYALDGVTTSNYFFDGTVANNGLPTGITSANNYLGMVNALSVNSAIQSDPSLIAAAGVAGQVGDNANAKAMFNLSSGGQFSTAVSSLVNTIGTDAQRYSTSATNYENLSTALQNQRESVSGVDLDEEATNLMAYQRGYQACARFINVIDQLTNQLINNFGV
ncbi:flagellar hook-associated protein FlgK [Holophaga foetida]|uniref:flagellar hook-associated protein FlgK n=1 Tax=Holophaga foetida TaxID=35839 RepID=UPI0002474D0A|nr:flagellar hook-associated protein FlgK [Holophaga foetida]